ncbi:MAG: nucleoside triphosphate pyrophosphohydrolase [bacterium]|nr:nucleoside triphosphate pyrophosphohydrolase [bacterium]
MESYNKLVRDKIPEILDKKGLRYERRVASLEEYKVELIRKLGEEVGEFEENGSSEELADVLEVIEALKQLPEYADVEEGINFELQNSRSASFFSISATALQKLFNRYSVYAS